MCVNYRMTMSIEFTHQKSLFSQRRANERWKVRQTLLDNSPKMVEAPTLRVDGKMERTE